MKEEAKNLLQINVCLFCEDMYISSGIYYKNKNSYILLCRDITLTSKQIDNLRYIDLAHKGIYVEDTYYADILKESSRCYGDKFKNYDEKFYKKLEVSRKKYNELTLKTFSLLSDAEEKETISLEIAQEVSKDILNMLEDVGEDTVLQCINEVKQSDDYLYHHCLNVAMLNGLVADWLGLAKAQKEMLIKVGLLHDIGKLKIPKNILNKIGKLTKSEFEVMKNHPIYSYNMLVKSGEKDEQILIGVKGHHEKVNGTGYPERLHSYNISLFSRITAVCDVYDAMVSKRCYKEALLPFDVMQLFSENKFSDLDIKIVDIFLQALPCLLVGRHVMLSSRDEAVVVYVRPEAYAYPVVRLEDRILITDEKCKCIVMCSKDKDE